LTDKNGQVIFGDIPRLESRQLSQNQLDKGIPIESNGETVGWLVFSPLVDRWTAGTPEGNFLLGVQNAIRISAVLASGIALLLGGFLAYTLTRQLRELTAATQELSKGKLGTQVAVRSQDELGTLAESFNKMSTDLANSVELRRRMTADIAHDLRTPLSVIMGYTEALSDGKLEPAPEMYEVMHTEALHLNHLIDDLKTLSLADAGELPLYPQRISPGKLLTRAADAYRIQAEQRQVEIQVDIPPDLPEVEVDVERMAQVLGNLMSNALRHTPSGGKIRLAAQQAADQVILYVADTGSGIDPQDLPFIFERSFRGEKSRVQNEGETGLGLAIARSLVVAQGGTIDAESTLGEGTRFKIAIRPASSN
jgi:signal transduction histidine kinase